MKESLAVGLFRLAAHSFSRTHRVLWLDDMTATFRDALQQHPHPLSFTLRACGNAFSAGLLERFGRHPLPVNDHSPLVIRPSLMNSFLQDIRHGARSLRKSPGFSAVAVLTIGLGLGANTAIFSVLNGVLLRPLPFREPERLVSLWETRLDRGFTQTTFSRPNFWDVKDQQHSFEGVAAMENGAINLTGKGFPTELALGRVTANFFQLLGVTPLRGRSFAEGDDAPGANADGVILSYRAWRSWGGSDHQIVGKPLTLNGRSYTVIGVLPRGEPWLNEAEVFLPLQRQTNSDDRGSWEIFAIGRLKPGIKIEAASAELNAIGRRLGDLYPKDDKGMGVLVQTSRSWIASDTTRRALWVLMGSVGFLLLIACVNLANLFLAKATGKARERALRAALGASRLRLARQTLTETLLVSGAGALGGLGLAFGTVKLLQAWNPVGIPRVAELGINAWVLGFTGLATLLTALCSGILPALLGTRDDLATSLREGERNVGGGRFMGRLRGGLVALEVAASLALLVGAGLLLRSFQSVMGREKGLHTEDRVLTSVSLPGAYNSDRTTQFIRDLSAKLQAHREITSVAAVSMRPFSGVGTGMGFGAADKPDLGGKDVPWAGWRLITKDYFKTVGVPLVAGRDFTEQDIIAKPWRVIVSHRLAERLWPGENAVGRTLVMWKGQSNDPAEIIGVAGDMRDWGLTEEQSFAVYFPYYGGRFSPVNLVIGTRKTPAEIQQLLRSDLGQLDANLPLGQVRTLDSLLGDSVASRRFIMLLLASFAGVALLLALVGVYGVLSYGVSRRTAEIGVRLAMGASPRGVLALIVRQGMQPVLLGAAVGLGGAILLTRLMRSLLFGISATDLVTYIGVSLVLGVAALLSCYWPARQALKVDVVAALRQE
jgi:putative ABC transport system permease protein